MDFRGTIDDDKSASYAWRRLVLALLFAALFAAPAEADCPSGADLVGPHTRTSWVEGGLVYDLSNGELKTCDGTNWQTVSGGAASSGLAGYVQLSDGAGGFATSGATAGEQLFWDNTNKRLGIGTSTPNASALLDVSSTAKGFLPPRMTTTQRDAITAPAEGLVVYNTTTKSLDLRVASSWLSFGGSMSGNTIVAGWPDAIRCEAGGASGIFFLQTAGGATTEYHTLESSSVTRLRIVYTAAGAYSTNTNASAYDCASNSWSITQLYANGRAINLVGGATASADGSAGKVQFNEGGNVKADADLHWDNTNKRLGIGTATPSSMLHVAGGIQLGDDTATCPGASDVKLGTLRFNGGDLEICKTSGWSATTGGSTTLADLTDVDVSGATNGQFLIFNGTEWEPQTISGGSSQWTTAGSDVYYGTGDVAIGQSAAPDASAALEVESATKGFLPPRMSTAERLAIASPAAGLMVYDTTLDTIAFFNGTAWSTFGPSSPADVFVSCKAALDAGLTSSGVYTLNPGSGNITAYCDMTTDGGGWTLVIYNKEGDNVPSVYTTSASGATNIQSATPSEPGKFSDTVINQIAQSGENIFRYNCGPTYKVFMKLNSAFASATGQMDTGDQCKATIGGSWQNLSGSVAGNVFGLGFDGNGGGGMSRCPGMLSFWHNWAAQQGTSLNGCFLQGTGYGGDGLMWVR